MTQPLTPSRPCGSGCAQLELFTPPAETSPAVLAEFDWDRHDVVVVGDSGGKDSGVLVHTVCTQADQAGQLHKVKVLHCDLGRTPNGHLIEWPGALEVARDHAALYDVPFAVYVATSFADRETHLARAIESHRLIGQAIGILIERHRATPAEAFTMLKKASQDRNIKLREIAARVIETGVEPDDAV